MHRFSFEPVRALCPRTHWTGYLTPAEAQGELFAEEQKEVAATGAAL